MPVGCNLSSDLRQLLRHHFVVKHFDAETVWDLLFESDKSKVSLNHLRNLRKFFLSKSTEEINSYIFRASEKSGCKRAMDEHACDELLELQRKDNTKTTVSSHHKMKQYYYDPETDGNKHPSVRTAQRNVKRAKISRKVLTVKNLALDQCALAGFFERVLCIY